jgi:hypothetical protein
MSSVFAVLTASTTAFAATNLDDLFLLTVFFGRRVPSRWIVAGQYLGRVPGAHDMESAAVDGRRWRRRVRHSLEFLALRRALFWGRARFGFHPQCADGAFHALARVP